MTLLLKMILDAWRTNWVSTFFTWICIIWSTPKTISNNVFRTKYQGVFLNYDIKGWYHSGCLKSFFFILSKYSYDKIFFTSFLLIITFSTTLQVNDVILYYYQQMTKYDCCRFTSPLKFAKLSRGHHVYKLDVNQAWNISGIFQPNNNCFS